MDETLGADGATLPPDGFDSLLRRALRLHNQGQIEAAEQLYKQCLRRSIADQATSLHLLGVAAKQSGRLEQGAALMQRAIQIDPERPHIHHELGQTLEQLHRHDQALAQHEQAIRLKPDYAEAHCNKGRTLDKLKRFEDAIASYDRAIAFDPNLTAAYNNRGLSLQRLGRIDEAIADFDRAVSLSPDFPIAHYNRGRCLLLAGEIEAGLREFEWRKQCPGLDRYRPLQQALWLGLDPLAGKTIFVYPELYLGDTIQFCRYVLLLEQRGARVILAAQTRLHRLLASLSPTIEIAPPDAAPAAIDYHCPLLSLPFALRTTLETIPGHTPYLSPEPERVRTWRRKIGDHGFRIGICWQGSARPYAADMQRSFTPMEFRAIAQQEGVRLISLQTPEDHGPLADLPPGLKVETLGDDFDAGPDGFLDAAAAMASMDLIITTDTSIAHLAGALGRPTWVALPRVPDWRWMLGRADSPWYPTMRLFRQTAPGDWRSVFSAIEDALPLEMARATSDRNAESP